MKGKVEQTNSRVKWKCGKFEEVRGSGWGTSNHHEWKVTWSIYNISFIVQNLSNNNFKWNSGASMLSLCNLSWMFMTHLRNYNVPALTILWITSLNTAVWIHHYLPHNPPSSNERHIPFHSVPSQTTSSQHRYFPPNNEIIWVTYIFFVIYVVLLICGKACVIPDEQFCMYSVPWPSEGRCLMALWN